MTQQAYETLLDKLARELNIEKIETDSSGSFVLELDEARWISVAYSVAEDKLMCQLCLEPMSQPLDTSHLHYLLRQNDTSLSNNQQQHFSLIQAEQGGEEEDIIVLLLRLPVHDLSPKTFLQAVEHMLNKGLGAESYLLQTEQSEPSPPPVKQMALRA